MSTFAIPETPHEKPQAPEVPGWLLLSIDTLKLALPQKDVKKIELFSTLQVAVDGEAEAGWYEHNGDLWPAYCLDRHLSLQSEMPAARRYCVFFEVNGRTIGILCDHVSILAADEDLDLQPMRACMVLPCSPIKWIAFREGEVITVAHGLEPASYLSTMEEEHAKAV